MAANCALYNSFLKKILDGSIDLDTDTIKVALTTSSYIPSLTHDFFDDITDEVSSSGTGYTAGGATLSNIGLSTVQANSWATTWQAGTAYKVGDIVRPTAGNTWLYMCVVAGTSHGVTEPTWRTVFLYNNASTDNGVVWCPIGKSATVLTADPTEWNPASITARFAILYKSTGTAGTSPLIAWQEFSIDHTSTNGPFTVNWPTQGLLVNFGYQGV